MPWPLATRARRGDPAHAPLLDTAAIAGLCELARCAPSDPRPAQEVAHRRHGDLRSPWRGSGLDYEESRHYQPGDDVRQMNWRALARTGDAYVKVFRQERRSPVFILLDRRAPMRFGTRVRIKAAQAARAAALVAFAAHWRHASVGALLLDERAHWIAPAADEAGVFALVRAMAAPCPPLVTRDTGPALPGVLRELAAALERGTMLYLVSDFLDLDAACRPALLQLAREHRVCAVHVIDAAEERLPPVGEGLMQDCGAGPARVVDGADPAVARAFEDAARAHQDARERSLRGLGVTYLRLASDAERPEARVPLP